jgi:hypothetical protein
MLRSIKPGRREKRCMHEEKYLNPELFYKIP